MLATGPDTFLGRSQGSSYLFISSGHLITLWWQHDCSVTAVGTVLTRFVKEGITIEGRSWRSRNVPAGEPNNEARTKLRQSDRDIVGKQSWRPSKPLVLMLSLLAPGQTLEMDEV